MIWQVKKGSGWVLYYGLYCLVSSANYLAQVNGARSHRCHEDCNRGCVGST